jgi:hypothetical protein
MSTKHSWARGAVTLFTGLLLISTPDLVTAQTVEPSTPMAVAAQPTVTLQPGQDQLFSTPVFGDTSFCAKNNSRAPGHMHIASWFGAGGGPTIDVPAGVTQCHTGPYWGVPAKVFNTGSVTLDITVTP